MTRNIRIVQIRTIARLQSLFCWATRLSRAAFMLLPGKGWIITLMNFEFYNFHKLRTSHLSCVVLNVCVSFILWVFFCSDPAFSWVYGSIFLPIWSICWVLTSVLLKKRGEAANLLLKCSDDRQNKQSPLHLHCDHRHHKRGRQALIEVVGEYLSQLRRKTGFRD